MIIEKELKCTPEEFYDYMLDSVVEQIEHTFGRVIDKKEIKSGYTHKTQFTNKKTGSKRTTRYTITKAVPGKQFETVFSSMDHKSKVGYKMSPSEKGMHIKYEQTTEFANPKEAPRGLGGKIDQFFLKRKLSHSIRQVEKAVIKRRRELAAMDEEETADPAEE